MKVYRNKWLRGLPRQKMTAREQRMMVIAEEAFRADGMEFCISLLLELLRTRDLWLNDAYVVEAALSRIRQLNERGLKRGKTAKKALAMLKRQR